MQLLILHRNEKQQTPNVCLFTIKYYIYSNIYIYGNSKFSPQNFRLCISRLTSFFEVPVVYAEIYFLTKT